MPDETTIAEVREAYGEMRQMVEGKIKADDAKMAEIDKTLDGFEEVNQKATLEYLATKKREDEANDRIAVIEAELAKRVGPVADPKREEQLTEEYKSFERWFKTGDKGTPIEQKAQLRTDDDTSAGYLVPDSVDSNMLKKITELDPMWGLASSMTITTKSVEVIVEASIPVAEFEGELEQGTQSEAAYENVTMTTYRQTFQSRVTQDQLMNSGWPMEAQMSMGAATAFAKGAGTNFVTGTGFKQPEGFTVNATIANAATDTSTNDALLAVDVLTLWGVPKVGYELTWMMNRAVMVAIRKFVATTGSFLWTPGLNGPVMSTLCGEPYVLSPAMSSAITTDGAIVLAIGDFRMGYRIVNRTGMSVIRDDLTEARKANVLITYNRWLTGRVVLPEAISIMTLA